MSANPDYFAQYREHYGGDEDADQPATVETKQYTDTESPFAKYHEYYGGERAQVEDEGEDDPEWGDYGRMIGAGGVQLGSGIGWLFNNFEWGASLQSASSDLSKSIMEGLSPQAKAAMQVEFTKRDGGDLWSNKKWNKAKLIAAQSLIGTAAGMGAGAVFTKGLAAAGMRKAATTAAGAATTTPTTAARMIGFGAGEAGVAAPSSAAGVEEEIEAMTHESLMEASIDYRATFASLEGTEEDRQRRARTIIAKAAAGDAFSTNLVTTFLLSAPFGVLTSKITSRITGDLPLATTRPRAIGLGALGEGGQEFLQSGAEKIGENVAMQSVDPDRPWHEGVAEEAVGGAIAGKMMGGVVGGFTALDSADGPPLSDEESPLSALAEADQAEKDELDEQLEAIGDEHGAPFPNPTQDELDATLEWARRVVAEQKVAGDLAVAEDARRGQKLVELEVQHDARLQAQKDAAVLAAQEKRENQQRKDDRRKGREEDRGFEAIDAERQDEDLERMMRQAEARGGGLPPGGGAGGMGVQVGGALQQAQQAEAERTAVDDAKTAAREAEDAEDAAERGEAPLEPKRPKIIRSSTPSGSIHSIIEQVLRTPWHKPGSGGEIRYQLDADLWIAEGLDPEIVTSKEFKYGPDRKPLFGPIGHSERTGERGLAPDDFAEIFNENGAYVNPATGNVGDWSSNDALSAVMDELNGGDKIYSLEATEYRGSHEAYERDYSDYQQELENYETRAEEIAERRREIRGEPEPAPELNEEEVKTNVDDVLQKARDGDKQAQESLRRYKLGWDGNKTKYRKVGKSEVDKVLAGKKVISTRHKNSGRTDITDDPNYGAVRMDSNYRITFKQTDRFDSDLPVNETDTTLKNEDAGEYHLRKGYSLEDVERIEEQQEDGTWKEIYSDKGKGRGGKFATKKKKKAIAKAEAEAEKAKAEDKDEKLPHGKVRDYFGEVRDKLPGEDILQTDPTGLDPNVRDQTFFSDDVKGGMYRVTQKGELRGKAVFTIAKRNADYDAFDNIGEIRQRPPNKDGLEWSQHDLDGNEIGERWHDFTHAAGTFAGEMGSIKPKIAVQNRNRWIKTGKGSASGPIIRYRSSESDHLPLVPETPKGALSEAEAATAAKWMAPDEVGGELDRVGELLTGMDDKPDLQPKASKIMAGLAIQDLTQAQRQRFENYNKELDAWMNNQYGDTEAESLGTMPVDQQLDELVTEIREAYKNEGLVNLDMQIEGKEIRLQDIEIATDSQRIGTGSKIIRELIDFAEDVNMVLRLEPALDEETLGPREGLAQFYSNAGLTQDTEFPSEWIYTPTAVKDPRVGQGDMFGKDPKADLAKLERKRDKKRNQGQEESTTGKPDDLFTGDRDQQDLVTETHKQDADLKKISKIEAVIHKYASKGGRVYEEVKEAEKLIYELAESGNPVAYDLLKDLDFQQMEDDGYGHYPEASTTDPRFKRNKKGRIEGVSGMGVTFRGGQRSNTVHLSRIVISNENDKKSQSQYRLDRFVQVWNKTHPDQLVPGSEPDGGTPPDDGSPGGAPPGSGGGGFTINEKNFEDVGPDTIERVFTSTVVKKGRKGIDIQLKNEGNVYITPEEAESKVDEWEDRAIEQGKESRKVNHNGPEAHKDNFNRVIISLFDTTGVWANPYALAGYDVRTLDLKDGIDVMDFSTQFMDEMFNNFEGKEIYGILAACPCTTFSNSSTKWRRSDLPADHPQNRHENADPEMSRKWITEMWGKEAADAVDEDGNPLYATPHEYAVALVHKTLQTLEYFRPKFWALENPEGRIESSAGLPGPWRTGFQPSNFGDPYTKRTLLWGEFDENLPTANVDPTEGSKMHMMPPSEERQAARSQTPEGFAYAFFMANNFLDMDPVERTKADYWYIAGAVEEAMRAGVTENQIREALYVEEDYEGSDGDEERVVLRELIAKAQTPGTPAPAAPAEQPGNVETVLSTSFASGMGATADFEAGLQSDQPFGVDIGILSKDKRQQIVEAVSKGHKIFVDSGAFRLFRESIKKVQESGQVDFLGQQIKALNDTELMRSYKSIAGQVHDLGGDPKDLSLVMPDVVGDPAATLHLLNKHLDDVVELIDEGHDVIIPIQVDEQMSAIEFVAEVTKLMPPGVASWRWGIPSNAKAMSDEALAEFVSEVEPSALHILGAVQGSKLKPRIAAISKGSNNELEVDVSADGNIIRSSTDELTGLKGMHRSQKLAEVVQAKIGDQQSVTESDLEYAQEGREEDAAVREERAETYDIEEELDDIPGWEDIDAMAATSPNNDKPVPTDPQKSAGNYPMAHIKFFGMDITIENPASDESRGGPNHYGYIRLVEGNDQDKLDIFINPNIKEDFPRAGPSVWVIDHMDQKTNQFEQHKVMFGYKNQLAAVKAYKKSYDKGWKVGPVTEMEVADLHDWMRLKDGNPPARLTRPLKPEFFNVQSKESGRAGKGKPQKDVGKQRYGTRDARFAAPGMRNKAADRKTRYPILQIETDLNENNALDSRFYVTVSAGMREHKFAFPKGKDVAEAENEADLKMRKMYGLHSAKNRAAAVGIDLDQEKDTIDIPIGRGGLATQPVPRFMWHNLFGRPAAKDGGINAYQLRPTEVELTKMWKGGKDTDKMVYLSQEPIGDDAVRVDLSMLNAADLRMTGQVEGHVIYRGNIPSKALKSGARDAKFAAPGMRGIKENVHGRSAPGIRPTPTYPVDENSPAYVRAWNAKAQGDPAQRETPQFKKWFGDSKIVDADGNPLIVYHGTNRDFTVFRSPASRGPKRSLGGHGIYFTPSPEYASAYTGRTAGGEKTLKPGGRVMPVYISLQNPKIISDKNWWNRYKRDDKQSQRSRKIHGMDLSSGHVTGQDLEDYRAAGYDGILNPELNEIVVFDATSVKSATGNRGTFSKADADIRFAAPKTSAFKKWFGDSKAVNEDGSPRLVFHGSQFTESPITEFNPQGGFGGWNHMGTWFTSDEGHAKQFAMQPRLENDMKEVPNGPVIPAFISIQNPFNATFDFTQMMISNLMKKQGISQFGPEAGPAIRKHLQKLGYDGVIIKDFEGDGLPAQTLYVPFESNQIKSPENQGSFRSDSPNIMYSSGQIDMFGSAQNVLNAPNQKWVNTVVGRATPVETPISTLERKVDQTIELQGQRETAAEAAAAEETAQPAPYTRQDLETDTQVLRDSMPDVVVHILDSHTDAPTEVIAMMREADMMEAPSVMVPSTGEIYMFSDRIDNSREAAGLLIHETVHKGLPKAFGKELDPMLQNLYDNIPDAHRPLLDEIIKEYKIDTNNPAEQRLAAEEVLTHLAEQDPKNSIVQEFVAKIRQLLRKMGVDMGQWTDEEIISVITEARGAVTRQDRVGDVTFDEDVEIEETGEVFTVQQSANEMLAQIQKRREMCQKISNCL